MSFKHGFIVVALTLCVGAGSVRAADCAACADAGGGYWDRSAAAFAARPGETDDAPRLQRAVDACANQVLFIPAGEYRLAQTLVVTNFCSILMHKNARLAAAKEMDFVVRVNNSPVFKARDILDFGTFLKGGRIDGKGMASCLSIHGYIHFSLRDVQFHNGRLYGLRVKGEQGPGGAELNAFNLHFVNKVKGNAGNAAVRVSGCDDNFTDCWAIDYTIGFDIEGGANFFTRCHVWGGVVSAPAPGEMPEYLKDSIGFKIRSSSNLILLRDCYADTSSIGFLNEGGDVRILGCTYLYNTGCIRGVAKEKRDKFYVFKQPAGSMVVADCVVNKGLDDLQIYEGNNRAVFRDIIYSGGKLKQTDICPGEVDFTPDQSVASADDWNCLSTGALTFRSNAGEFTEEATCRSVTADAGTRRLLRKFPKSGAGKEVVVKLRALDPQTKSVEMALHFTKGRVWGLTVPLTEDWRELRIPFEKLSYFSQWKHIPRQQPGDHPDATQLLFIGFNFGHWLCADTTDRPHAFEVESVRIVGR